MPTPKFTALDNNGNIVSGALLDTYSAGTSTLLSTYSDAALLVPNTNPVVCDSAGRATVFLAASSYKFRLRTAAGVTLWTVDGVASTGLSQSIVGVGGIVKHFGGSELSPIVVTSYPSGTTFDLCHPDTDWLTIDSALLIGTFVLNGMLLCNGGTITAGIFNLSDGAPDTPLATIASSSTTGADVTSTAITFATAGTPKIYAIKAKVSAGAGCAWGLNLVRSA